MVATEDGPAIRVRDAIRTLRTRHKLSARATSLAAGLSESYVGKVESGDIEMSLRAFALLAHALHLSDREIATLVHWAAA